MNTSYSDHDIMVGAFSGGRYDGFTFGTTPQYHSMTRIPSSFTYIIVYKIGSIPVSDPAYLLSHNIKPHGESFDTTRSIFSINARSTIGVTERVEVTNIATNETEVYTVSGRFALPNRTTVKIVTVNATAFEVYTNGFHRRIIEFNSASTFIPKDFDPNPILSYAVHNCLGIGGALYAKNTKSYGISGATFAEFWRLANQPLSATQIQIMLNYTNSKYGIWPTAIKPVTVPLVPVLNAVPITPAIEFQLIVPSNRIVAEDIDTVVSISIVSGPIGGIIRGPTQFISAYGSVICTGVSISGPLGIYTLRATAVTVEQQILTFDFPISVLQPMILTPVQFPADLFSTGSGQISPAPSVTLLDSLTGAVNINSDATIQWSFIYDTSTSIRHAKPVLGGVTTTHMMFGNSSASQLTLISGAGRVQLVATHSVMGIVAMFPWIQFQYIPRIDFVSIPTSVVAGTEFNIALNVSLRDALGRICIEEDGTVVWLVAVFSSPGLVWNNTGTDMFPVLVVSGVAFINPVTTLALRYTGSDVTSDTNLHIQLFLVDPVTKIIDDVKIGTLDVKIRAPQLLLPSLSPPPLPNHDNATANVSIRSITPDHGDLVLGNSTGNSNVMTIFGTGFLYISAPVTVWFGPAPVSCNITVVSNIILTFPLTCRPDRAPVYFGTDNYTVPITIEYTANESVLYQTRMRTPVGPVVYTYIPSPPSATAVSPSVLFLYKNTTLRIRGDNLLRIASVFLAPVDAGTDPSKATVSCIFNSVQLHVHLDTMFECQTTSIFRDTVVLPADLAMRVFFITKSSVEIIDSGLKVIYETSCPETNFNAGTCQCPGTQYRDSLTKQCVCPRGFMGAQCDTPTLASTFASSVFETSEDGASVDISATNSITPSADVIVQIRLVNGADKIQLSTRRWVWAKGSVVGSTQTVRVSGVNDQKRDGNITYLLVFGPIISDDIQFTSPALLGDVGMRNIESRPRVVALSPSTVGIGISTFRMTLEHVDSEFVISLGTVLAPTRVVRIQQHRLQMQEMHLLENGTRLVQELTCVDSLSSPSSCTVTLNVTFNASLGYQAFSVYNVYTQTHLIHDPRQTSGRVFSTDLCTEPTWWGERGIECRPCPDGGVCPGGKRLWPQAGYWNEGEHAIRILNCKPPATERCIGGPASDCGQGYEGYLCGSCSDGYFEDKARAGACTRCSSDGGYFTGIVANLALVLILAIGAGFFSNESLGTLCTIVLTLQNIYAVGQMAGSDVPQFTGQFYAAMGIFALNMQVAELKCLAPGVTTFGISFFVYWFTMLTSIVLGATFVVPGRASVTIPDAYKYHPSGSESTLYNPDPENATPVSVSAPVPAVFKSRLGRLVVVTFAVYHFLGIQLGIQALFCISDPRINRLVLVVEPVQECFTGIHFVYFFVGVATVITGSAGALVGLWWILYPRHTRVDAYTHFETVTVIGVMYLGFRPPVRWFAAVSVCINLALAAMIALGATDVIVINIAVIVIVGLACILRIVCRPCEDRVENIGSLGADITCIIASIVAILAETWRGNASTDNAMVLQVCGYILFLCTVMTLGIFVVKLGMDLWRGYTERASTKQSTAIRATLDSTSSSETILTQKLPVQEQQEQGKTINTLPRADTPMSLSNVYSMATFAPDMFKRAVAFLSTSTTNSPSSDPPRSSSPTLSDDSVHTDIIM